MTTEEGIARLASFFSREPTRTGLLARRLLATTLETDAGLAETLTRQLSSDLRSDGSVSGAFVATAWRVIELVELGGSNAAARSAAWLLERQGAPGNFGEGCTPPRHAAQACEHYIGGFFSVADWTVRVAPLTMPTGKVLRSERAARFAASCLALRAVTVAGHGANPAVRRHVESLSTLVVAQPLPSDHLTLEMLTIVLSTLARCAAPADSTRTALRDMMVHRQRNDGTWPGLDHFLALEAVLADGQSSSTEALRRAVPHLLGMQRPDGSFGALARQERAWIGLQAMTAAGTR